MADTLHLDPFSAMGSRNKQAQDARDMQQVVIERAKRSGNAVPPYDFIELIGKGSFGRVYKCKHQQSREVVAVKIIDVDDLDYRLDNAQKDEAIEDFIKEVNALKAVKDSKAKNINHIQEAFDLHSQLWIVSDYCSGGSVNTLLKPTNYEGFEESFIVPLARELAIALAHVHDAGIIHRDIKCGNVLVSEDGHLQLCDFGVAGRMESDVSKRSTIVGTPNWMAPEMHAPQDGTIDQSYGFEIDCWAYGCTVYEMATGRPPYANFHPSYLQQVLQSVPRLDEEKYTAPLCDFVAFILQEKPQDRPTAKQILEHPYIAGTESRFPTTSLRSLIDSYVQWERKGNQRQSLFHAGGAAPPQLEDHRQDGEEWIFSTTSNFDQDYEQRYSRLPPNIASFDFAGGMSAEDDAPSRSSVHMTPFEKATHEARAVRGERYLDRLFDPESVPYDYTARAAEDDEQPLSDLPLRNLSSDRSANRETLIDLDTSGLELVTPTFNFDFSDVPTVKGHRKSNAGYEEEEDGSYEPQEHDPKRETMAWTFPSLNASEPENSGTMKRSNSDLSVPIHTAVPITDETVDSKSEEQSENVRRPVTMDWSFATAGPSQLEAEPEPDYQFPSTRDSDETNTGFRPSLARTATEPIGQFDDHFHPPAASLDADRVVNRESTPMIDLDFADDIQPRLAPNLLFEGPSPPASGIGRSSSIASMSTHSLTSIGPFDLEQDPLRREDDMQTYSHHREELSAGGPTVAERRLSGRYLNANHSSTSLSRSRGASFDSTASSIPDDPTDDSTAGRDYNRSMGAKMREQLRAGLHRSYSQRHVRQDTSDSYGDTDTGSDRAEYTNGNGHGGGASPYVYDTDGSPPDERQISRAGRSFPEPRFPPASALREGASHDELFDELDGMFKDLQAGLNHTAAVLRRRETELAGDEAGDSASDAGGGMAGEEERQWANFS